MGEEGSNRFALRNDRFSSLELSSLEPQFHVDHTLIAGAKHIRIDIPLKPQPLV